MYPKVKYLLNIFLHYNKNTCNIYKLITVSVNLDQYDGMTDKKRWSLFIKLFILNIYKQMFCIFLLLVILNQ